MRFPPATRKTVVAGVLLLAVLLWVTFWGRPDRIAGPLDDPLRSPPPFAANREANEAVAVAHVHEPGPAAARPAGEPPRFRSECSRPKGVPQDDALVHQAVREMASSAADDLRVVGQFMTAIDPTPDPAKCDGDDCSAAVAAREQVRADAIAALSAAASAGSDPTTYALAVHACVQASLGGPTPAGCVNVTFERLASLDPDSVRVWLALAARAANARDLSGVENAIYRASVARNWSSRIADALAAYGRSVPSSLYAGDAFTALFGVVNGGFETGVESGLARYCHDRQTANANLLCRKLAADLLDHATSLLTLKIAIGAAERSGVDEARTERARVVLQTAFNAFPAPADGGDCHQIDDMVGRLYRQSQIGELAVLTELANRTGKPGR